MPIIDKFSVVDYLIDGIELIVPLVYLILNIVLESAVEVINKGLFALACLVRVLYKLGSIAPNRSYLANVLDLADGGSVGVAVSIELLYCLAKLRKRSH